VPKEVQPRTILIADRILQIVQYVVPFSLDDRTGVNKAGNRGVDHGLNNSIELF